LKSIVIQNKLNTAQLLLPVGQMVCFAT